MSTEPASGIAKALQSNLAEAYAKTMAELGDDNPWDPLFAVGELGLSGVFVRAPRSAIEELDLERTIAEIEEILRERLGEKMSQLEAAREAELNGSG